MGRRVPLPDYKNPNTWERQMHLEKIGESQFRSTFGAPFGTFVTRDGEQRPRAFGGHVYAQAAYAASKTLDPKYLIHSISGYFLILGLADEPFTYDVNVLRNGRGYCVRRVDVWQEDKKIVFSCICSFKQTEEGFLDIQEPQFMENKYAELLHGKTVEELTKGEFADMTWTDPVIKPAMLDSFPGMYTSILPFQNFHENQPPIDRQSLYIYSANLDPSTTPDFNLEACAHLYHSDRESIWSVLRQFELLDVIEVASSLSHTVTFHVGADKLRFFDKEGKRRWYFLETSAKRVNDGRGLHEGRVYDREGNHVASMMQDGAIRLRWKDEEEKNARQDKIQRDSKLKLKL